LQFVRHELQLESKKKQHFYDTKKLDEVASESFQREQRYKDLEMV